MARRGKRGEAADAAGAAFAKGLALVDAHPLYGALLRHVRVNRWKHSLCPPEGWAVVVDAGYIDVHPTRRGAPEEWARVLAHCLLHLGFGHFQERSRMREWNAACCAAVEQFLEVQKLGRLPMELATGELPPGSDAKLYESFCRTGVPNPPPVLAMSGPHVGDLWWSRGRAPIAVSFGAPKVDWPARFGEALAPAVSVAVSRAAGAPVSSAPASLAERGRRWFIDHYPLLGSLAVAFELVEDPIALARMEISIAAVDAEAKEIYVDSRRLDDASCRFVLAHEMLHVGLRHGARRQGRDPFLWNVACDYVINGWLVEMGLGDLPPFGALHDPALKGLSAEAVYDRIVTDLRHFRKVATLRGMALGDLLDGEHRDWWTGPAGTDLDAFYRRCLAQGLAYHEESGRGLLPSGLVEEIRALSQPPIPWDVELARWFDGWLAPLEQRRTYARASRRQQATPDIPRPRWTLEESALDGRTFGVVLDTSGSMDRKLLARALGAIASYATSRDVPAVRVVFCDAAAYDQGYLRPEEISGRVRVRGRGGTILQPGIDLLQRAPDFPPDGPLLVITDGACDRLQVRREHAFLVPPGRSLPFVPKGPVFRIS
jgi:predicted metal-dependent peptidase